MSKSHWLKDEDQKGNFSNEKQDTFDPKKRYIGIRLQQGVPLLDRDWNELEDMRRYTEIILRKYYIGNGTPDDGFSVSLIDVSTLDFRISAGRCLVDGFDVVNEPYDENGNKLNFILYSQQEGVPPLTTGTQGRLDTVYLDVWVEEISKDRDSALGNSQDIDMETCRRHKLEWRVRVDEGSQGYEKQPFHHYYDIAKLSWRSSGKLSHYYEVEDLRVTGLTVFQLREEIESLKDNAGKHTHSKLVSPGGASDPALQVDNNGNVGIGTTAPRRKIHIQGLGSAKFFSDSHDRPALAITGHYPGLHLFSSVNDIKYGPAIRLGGYDDDSQETFKQWTIGTSGRNSAFLDFGFSSTDPNIHAGIRDHNGKTVMTLLENGNVGIGTTAPAHKLEVHGKLWVRSWMTVGCDYSEYFESQNGKAIPPGTAVVLKNGKVRRANKNETPLGIISSNPGMASGVHVEWPKKYLQDEFGNQIMEEYKEEIMVPKKEKVKKERQKIKKKTVKEKVTRTEVVKVKGKYRQKEVTETIEREIEEPVFKEVNLYDAKGKNVIGKHRIPVMETDEEEIDLLDEKGQPVMVGTGKFETKTRPKINPEYDEKKEYIPREKRPEWNCVGLLGQLPLRKGQPVADTWIKIKDISKDVELWLVK